MLKLLSHFGQKGFDTSSCESSLKRFVLNAFWPVTVSFADLHVKVCTIIWPFNTVPRKSLVPFSCADSGSFVRGGPTNLITFFFFFLISWLSG